MAYVYRHIRLDKNIPFYIGIGSDSSFKRAKDLIGRNNIWKRIKQKTQIEIEILIDEITWEGACEKEKEFIGLYGRINNGTGILANLTDGGDGNLGAIVSEETRQKLSLLRKGKKKKPETVLRMKAAQKNRKPISDETRALLSKIRTGVKPTAETIAKRSAGLKGKHPMTGKKMSEEQILFARQYLWKTKKVINESTGIIYESAKMAAADLNINYSTFKDYLSGARPNKTQCKYL